MSLYSQKILSDKGSQSLDSEILDYKEGLSLKHKKEKLVLRIFMNLEQVTISNLIHLK